jgi:Calx-beta domain-containing protein
LELAGASLDDVMARVAPRRSLTVLVALALGGPGIAAGNASAQGCLAPTGTRQTQHISLWLTGLPAEATATHPFYFAAEDAGSGRFQVLGGAHVCNESASVRYSTDGGTATASADFEPRAGRANFTIVHTSDPWNVDVPILPDADVEAPVESFRVALSRPRNGSLRIPSEAPFHIIDVDGEDRATLAPEPYLVSEFDGIVGIAVFRAGPATSSVNVAYQVDATGTQPATPGEDFTISSANPLSFGPGQRVKLIQIAIANDGVPEADETLRISLTGPSPGAVTETTMTIDGEIDASPPRSRFHHPRMGWEYAPQDYRIREIHVFTGDGDDSGVVRLDLALRRNFTSGACSWWGGERFRRGDCTEPEWVRMRAYEPGWFYYYRIDPLAPSMGTRTKSYTAFARGTDAAGNVEDEFIAGRNENTFEVQRREER